MKKVLYFIFGAFAMGGLLTSCDPMHQSSPEIDTLSSADQINATVTPIVNSSGQNTNKAICKYSGKGMAQFSNVTSIVSNNDTIQLFATGDQTVTCTVQDQEGKTFSKDYTINVQSMDYPVDAWWSYLTGGSSKTWVWDDQGYPTAVWGNGGYIGNTSPTWWAVSISDIEAQATGKAPVTSSAGDGTNASITFTLQGAKVKKSDGKEGSFAFDRKVDDNQIGWAIGHLKFTGLFPPMGILTNVHNTPVYTYRILKITDSKLVLSVPEDESNGAWGTAWFWMFRQK